MPINVAAAMTARLEPIDYAWDEDRVILYHLGLGAGAAFTDPKELEYTYEKCLKVLPTFAVLPGFGMAPQVVRTPGLDIDMSGVVHGEHEIALEGPLPVAARVRSTAAVTGVYDRGSGAAIAFRIDTADRDSGKLLFSNTWTLFARGAGGFGGPAAPRPEVAPPQRAPDAEMRSPLIPQIAQIYRLSGDKAFLHIDPELVKPAGFDRPIAHGLCSMGVVTKAVVDGLLGGDVARVRRVRMRFAKPVFPGETIVTRAWAEGGRVAIEAVASERGENVVTQAWMDVGDPPT
jgi:acyl dehydratase